MPLATHKVLSTVELLQSILSHLEDTQTLAACARVDRRWSQVSIPLLWHGSLPPSEQSLGPTAYDLVKLAQEPDRYSKYTRYIRYLELDMNHPKHQPLQCYDALYENLLWKHASYQYLSVDLCSPNMNEADVMVLLQPNLIVLNLFGGSYSDQFLLAIEERCPKLKALLIDNNHRDGFTSQSFSRFLRSMRQIEAIELWHGNTSTVNENVLVELADMPSLRYLSLGETSDLTMRVLNRSRDKFQHVRSLSLSSIHGSAAKSLLPSLEDLRQLNLNLSSVDDIARDIFIPLGQCTSLSVLTLCGCVDRTFTEEALIREALQSMLQGTTRLRKLELLLDPLFDSTRSIGLETLNQIASNAPLLEQLTIEYPCEPHTRLLQPFAQYCPRLQSLHLNTEITIESFSSLPSNTQLPQLQGLTVRDFVLSPDVSTAAQVELQVRRVGDVLKLKTPRLHYLYQNEYLSIGKKKFLREVPPMKGILPVTQERRGYPWVATQCEILHGVPWAPIFPED